MNYLIAHQVHHYPYLHTTARKKTLKHKLMTVLKGLMSVRLGKNEYLVTAGNSIWLPFDCLTAISYFPNCQVLEVEISSRSTQVYPFQAGFIDASPLLSALLDTLKSNDFDVDNEEQRSWLTALNFQLTKLTPTLTESHLTLEALSPTASCQANLAEQGVDVAEVQLALQVRQAIKARSSGSKPQKIINDLFDGNHELAQQLCLSIANHSL
ncbi:hypothetical protein [Vibrio aphrogenes]|uniref:hypothetical protein n=1 Tax=Vibrio aphrogenes TaxID=1891186 RepID=UPI000B358806|nr:hypothetical protein [Vibrio aphrogenes]